MKKNIKFFVILTLVSAYIVGHYENQYKANADQLVTITTPQATVDILTHKQRVYLGALEWCESQGEADIVNPKDRDNTPSYYYFQFKPDTFRGYGEKYKLIPKGKSTVEIMVLMKDHDLTIKIMEQLMLDPTVSNTEWRTSLFPGCTKKLGNPPRLSTTKALTSTNKAE